MSALLDSAVSPNAGRSEDMSPAKAVSFGEALSRIQDLPVAGEEECAVMVRHSQIIQGGAGGTDNHIVLVDLRTKFPT